MESPQVNCAVWYLMVNSSFETGKVLPFLPQSPVRDVSAGTCLLLLRGWNWFDSKAGNRHEHLNSGPSFMLLLNFKTAKVTSPELLLSFHKDCILSSFQKRLVFFQSVKDHQTINHFCIPCVINNIILSPNLCVWTWSREAQGLKFQGNISPGELQQLGWRLLL